jgi:F-type H+-transporting ATPase subunit delta
MSKLLPSQYAKILFSLTNAVPKDKLDEVIKEFFLFLKEERVLSKAKYIIREFEKFSKKQEGITELEIISSQELKKEEIDKIVKVFTKKAEVKTKVNKDLIGGIIIKTDNMILDASVKTQLNKLKQHLL